ncbi:hypothetical protein [Pedobacter sp. D749]|uniref:hypothetical protein n=1 Tax=Pedobacter sp. D749 TaxID=2856523 RepID=UPI001C59581D|nr:hypothetical protein [Pedobacter sp. D749]QXU42971.1 hypothetical protein KYH19_05075 [Pedobacter sp. D749]
MMEGENVKALAPPFNQPLPLGSTPSPIFHRGLVLATKKALTNLSDISSKPFSYALVFVVFKGRHAFAALRFVTFSSRKK